MSPYLLKHFRIIAWAAACFAVISMATVGVRLVAAQPATATAPSLPLPATTDLTAPSKKLIDWSSVLTSLVSLVVGWVAEHWRARTKFSEMLTTPPKLKSGHRRNTIMVVGDGNSGKSTLIKNFTDHLNLKTEKTTKFLVSTGGCVERDTHYHFVFADYVGQDLGTLISSFVQEQLKPYADIRYRYVNTLVFVVDLFDDAQTKRAVEEGDAFVPFETFNEQRVQEQLTLWNRYSLDAVFGMHGFVRGEDIARGTRMGLRLVTLLINKLDMVANSNDPAVLRRIKAAYDPLTRELSRRCRQKDEQGVEREFARFDCWCVSLKNGDRLPEIKQRFLTSSVPEAAS